MSVRIIIVAILFCGNLLFSQTELPDIIPPSPQSESLVKYIDFPMDLSNGLPQINIPLYTVKGHGVTLPITISYHASGLKPNEDHSGLLGLGWSLNCGGLISRTIHKFPDERYWNDLIPDEYEINSTLNNLEEDTDAYLLDQINRGDRDTEVDVFSYIMPGSGSGKFVFKRSVILSDFAKPYTLPYRPVAIKPRLEEENGRYFFSYFEINDENGILYRFGKSYSDNQYYEKYISSNTTIQETGISSWKLTEIISADRKDTIHLEYDDVLTSSSGNQILTSHRGFKKMLDINHNTNINSYSSESIWNGYNYTEKKIKKIIFKTGYIEFNYQSNIYPDHQLSNIKIFKSNQLVPFKTIEFSSSFYHSDDTKKNWKKLDSLKFLDEENKKIFKYSFDYNTSLAFPSIQDSFTDETYAIDYWGYYNGANNINTNPDFEWKGTLVSGPNLFGDANRKPNPNFSQVGILKSIIHPTKGKTDFIYEGNRDVSGHLLGGLRLKSLIKATDTNQESRHFAYSSPIARTVTSDYYKSHFLTGSGNIVVDHYSTSSEANVSLFINGSPAVYREVTEFIGGININNGKIEHLFDFSYLHPLKYDFWSIAKGYPWNHSNGSLMGYYDDLVFSTAYEKERRIFNSLGDTISETLNFYSYKLKDNFKGFKTSKIVQLSPNNYDKVYFYTFYNYDIPQFSEIKDSTQTTHYLASGKLSEKEFYSYNSNLFVTQKRFINSNGKTVVTTFKYPHDFAVSNNVYKKMETANILSPVIEEKIRTHNAAVSTTRTNYKDWGNAVYQPERIQSSKGTGVWQDRIVFEDYYANGKIKEVSKAGGAHIVYLWGYHGQYPIAKIENTTGAALEAVLGELKNVNESDLSAINDLRSNSAFKEAMITTFTYEPLVGMTSMTDPRGRTTTYHYDDFGRLEMVKDHEGKLVEEYEYHYKGE